ncbi:MAG: hypothetical protein HOQ05_04280 [Corynebacteriales bacterium]|nr:hypothetical protein [Mycobacteriales bacterium]
MGWFRRKKKDEATARVDAGILHLEQFIASRTGVEAYVEPKTAVTDVTLLLIAHDGEWTRRRVGSAEEAWAFGRKHNLPVYDANVVGYPQRMREWSSRHKKS